MKKIKVLSVCGSGTVSSAMVSQKIEEILEEQGFTVEATEVSPNGVDLAMQSGNFDMIAYTSPIHGQFDIPVINATGFLTGMNEDELIEKIIEVAKSKK